MDKSQKRVLMINATRLMFLLIIATVIVTFIFQESINGAVGGVCIMIPIMLWLVLVGLTLKTVGCPFNVINPNRIVHFYTIKDKIEIVEIQKGIWQIQDGGYKTILDMHHWIFKNFISII